MRMSGLITNHINSEFFKYSEFDYKENLPKIEKYDKRNLLVGYYGLAIVSFISQCIVWWTEYDDLVVATLFVIYHILAMTLLVIFIYPHIWKYELDYSENLGPFIAIRIFLQTFLTWVFLKEGHFILPHFYCNIWLFIAINEIRTVESDHVQIPLEETNEEESNKEALVLPTELPRQHRRRYVMLYPYGLYQNSKFFECPVSDYKENQPKIEKYDKWNLLVGYYGLVIISTIPQFIVCIWYYNIWLFIAINDIRTVESDHVQLPPEQRMNEQESNKEALVLPTEIPREQRRRYVMLYPHGLYQVYQ
ncbi:hypothetical protein CRE_06591 [Caenorhabditis remanei]|uniref:Uncharacterized protein n=1 Tax=Caenorhabditis remanei TaxID=31234 RepID=E3M1P2_CAERE|nr:hypothetical protein CRE_06591 [Caenorhabditis remanei]